MLGNPDITKVAQRMIDRYGDDALRQVDERVEELGQLDNDNNDVRTMWRQVRKEIETVLDQPSKSSTH